MEAVASAPPWMPEDDLRLKDAMEVILCNFLPNLRNFLFSPFTFQLLPLLPLKLSSSSALRLVFYSFNSFFFNFME